MKKIKNCCTCRKNTDGNTHAPFNVDFNRYDFKVMAGDSYCLKCAETVVGHKNSFKGGSTWELRDIEMVGINS